MKQKTHHTPTPYKTLSHTTTTRLPAVAPAPLAVSGQSDAQAMLAIYQSWLDEAVRAGIEDVLHYTDCVNFYARKVERESSNVEVLAL